MKVSRSPQELIDGCDGCIAKKLLICPSKEDAEKRISEIDKNQADTKEAMKLIGIPFEADPTVSKIKKECPKIKS